MRVLLADDDEDVRFVVSQLLGRRGWSLTTTTNGEETLALLAEESFDAVVLDENMPPGSGLEVARAVREAGNTTPIVLFTGFAPTVNTAEVQRLDVTLLGKAEVIRLAPVVASLVGGDE